MAGELTALHGLADESRFALGDGGVKELPIPFLPLRAILSQRKVARIMVEPLAIIDCRVLYQAAHTPDSRMGYVDGAAKMVGTEGFFASYAGITASPTTRNQRTSGIFFNTPPCDLLLPSCYAPAKCRVKHSDRRGRATAG